MGLGVDHVVGCVWMDYGSVWGETKAGKQGGGFHSKAVSGDAADLVLRMRAAHVALLVLMGRGREVQEQARVQVLRVGLGRTPRGSGVAQVCSGPGVGKIYSLLPAVMVEVPGKSLFIFVALLPYLLSDAGELYGFDIHLAHV